MTVDLVGKKIAVFSIYYAPDTTGIAPYATDLCELLADQGADVEGFVGVPHYPSWRVAPKFQWTLTHHEMQGGVRLHRGRHYVPRKQDPLRRGAYELSYWAWSRYLSRKSPADVVLAVTPNIGAIPAALSMARRTQAPVGVIAQDLMGQAARQSGANRSTTVAGLVSRAESRWLIQTDRVGVISRAFIGPIETMGVDASRVSYLPNYSHIVASGLDVSQAKVRLGWPESELTVTHTGNMGYKQDLDNVLQAARLIKESAPEIRFRLIGHGALRGELERDGESLRNVSFLDPLDRDSYTTALAASDILLVNERSTVLDMSLPSKLTSYFTAGRPVVAAVINQGATAQLVRESGAGVLVIPGRPEVLADALVTLASRPDERKRLGGLAQAFAARTLSAEAGRRRLLDFVNDVAMMR